MNKPNTPTMSNAPDPLVAELIAIVGASHVLTDDAATARYVGDWRRNFPGAARAVVRPASTAEVSRVVAACAANQVAVVPQGGNTGLVGGSTPDASRSEVLLSLDRMTAVRRVDPLDNSMTLEAGCTVLAAQEAAAAQGRLFPLSLASEGSATVGGVVSTNAGGEQVLRYGNTRDLTLGLEVVLADGRVLDALGALRKDNTGYDLKQLFIGGEGTLGIVTAATFKLFAPPRQVVTAWVAVRDPQAAVELLAELGAAVGERVTAFELMGARRWTRCWRTAHRACAIPCPAGTAGRCCSTCRKPPPAWTPRPRWKTCWARRSNKAWCWTRCWPARASRATTCGPCASTCPRPSGWTGRPSSTTSRSPSRASPSSSPRPARRCRPCCPACAWSASATSATATCTTTRASPGHAGQRLPAPRRHDPRHGARHHRAPAWLDLGRTRHRPPQQAAFLHHKPPIALELMARIKQAIDPANTFNPGRVLPRALPVPQPVL